MIVDRLAHRPSAVAANLRPPRKETTNQTASLDRSYHKQKCWRFVGRKVNLEIFGGL